jgi:preprotein translocase subunit YajC
MRAAAGRGRYRSQVWTIMDSLLSFFISDANAQAAAGSGAGGLSIFLLPAAFIAIFYFLLIRPQQKQQKDHRAMIDAIAVGNEIVTGGGVLGKVTELGEQFVSVEIADGVTIKVQKSSISKLLPKDTIRNA